MEVTSNGKIEETQNMQQEEHDKKLIMEDVEELKPDVESVREIVVDGNPEEQDKKLLHDGNSLSSDSSKEEAEVKEDSSSVDSGTVEEEEVEKEVINSIVEAVENSKDSVMNEVESKGTDESETNRTAAIAADTELNVTTGTMLLLSTPDGNDRDVSQLVSGGVEGMELPSSHDRENLYATETTLVSKGTEETALPSLDENSDVPPAPADVVSRWIEEVHGAPLEEKTGESSIVGDKESVENVDDTLKPLTNATIVGSIDGVPEITGNPHVVSVSQRTMQPTSWRSCCGLFEVLRRSR